MKIFKLLTFSCLFSSGIFAQQIDLSEVGLEHNNALERLNLTPSKLENINSATILTELKRSISNVPIEIDENLVRSTSAYLKSLTNGQTDNSILISKSLHNSLLDLVNQATQITSNSDSALSKFMIEQFNLVIENWYSNTLNTNQFNSVELAQLNAFRNTAKKSTEFWYGYVNQNNLQQENLTTAGRRFRLFHWIGVAIMDAGGALIGGAWGPVGSIVLGAAASGVAHALNP